MRMTRTFVIMLLISFGIVGFVIASEPKTESEPVAEKSEPAEKKEVKKAKKVTKKKTAVKPEQRNKVSVPPVQPVVISTAENFNSRIVVMAGELEQNLDRKNLSNTFIVTSFANLNKLSETTSFGRLVSENLIHELQLRKWHVFEVRLTKDIIINETGEFTLSRDIKQLKDQYKIAGIVTGTYSVTGNSIIVNARVIDINTGIVISSAQSNMPVNWFTDNLLYNEENLKTMRIVGNGGASVQRALPAPYPPPNAPASSPNPAGAGH